MMEKKQASGKHIKIPAQPEASGKSESPADDGDDIVVKFGHL